MADYTRIRVVVRSSLIAIMMSLGVATLLIAQFCPRREQQEQITTPVVSPYSTKTDGDWEVTHCFNVWQVLRSPAAHRMIICPYPDSPELWDTIAGKRIAILHASNRPIARCAISPSQDVVLTAEIPRVFGVRETEDIKRAIWFWDLATGAQVSRLDVDVSKKNLETMDWEISWIDANRIFIQINNREGSSRVPYWMEWRLCDISTGTTLSHILPYEIGNVGEMLTFSRDRKRAVASCDYSFGPGGSRGGRGGTRFTYLVDLDNGLIMATLDGFNLNKEGKRPSIGVIKWSPDGRYIATVRDDHLICVWEGEFGRPVARLRGHNSWIPDVSFSADGRFLVSSSDDESAIVWKVESGEQVAQFLGHDDGVNCARFDSEGKFVLTGSEDKMAMLWDANSGELITRFGPHDSGVRQVSFLNSDTIVTKTEEGRLREWSVKTGKLTTATESLEHETWRWDNCKITRYSTSEYEIRVPVRR